MRSLKLTMFLAAICAVSMLASCKKKEEKPSVSSITQAATETVNKAKEDAAPAAEKAKEDAKKALDNVTK